MLSGQHSAKFTKVPTTGDGNCAFNAPVLVICQKNILEQIETKIRSDGEIVNEVLADFIDEAAKALNIDNPHSFARVKEKLIELREKNPEKLQKQLAPVMRELACQRALANLDDYIVRTEDIFWQAYQYYMAHNNAGEDDIFFRAEHEKVFATITKKPAKTEDEVKAWWRKHGAKDFLKSMKTAGVWAGDLELSYLAAYFNLDFAILKKTARGEGLTRFHAVHGMLPFDKIIDI